MYAINKYLLSMLFQQQPARPNMYTDLKYFDDHRAFGELHHEAQLKSLLNTYQRPPTERAIEAWGGV
jgi:hypothetical protein